MQRLMILLPFIFLLACSANKETPGLDVGDIIFNPETDNPDFQLCDENNIKQYYSRYSSDKPATYKGEKKAIVQHFKEQYKIPKMEGENGYLTIRFVVNCKGESDRFRFFEMDFRYQEKVFAPAIREQLLKLTKSLDGWIPSHNNGVQFDFYQYLTFRLEDGQIKKIMP